MTDQAHLARMIAEFKRVGVDPNTFSAVLAVREEDALRALAALPDDAGPAAFLAQLRQLGVRAAPTSPPFGMPEIRPGPRETSRHDEEFRPRRDATGTE